MSKPVITLPAGVECGVKFFLTSDKTGIEVAVALSGFPVVPEFKDFADFSGARLLGSIAGVGRVNIQPLLEMADDWRLMTREEVAEYKAHDDDDD